MSTSLTAGSVCTGYGGLDLAVGAVLGTCPAWVADPDPGATRILAHRYPDVPNLGDITAVDWATVPPVDILTAGFPCQDLSYAGRGAGIKEGTRSGLWFTIAHAVGLLRPRLILLENVAAIVARRPGLDVVTADLAALGFDAEWTCVRACDVGAPHRRERWFCLAWPADSQSARRQGPHPRRRRIAGDGDGAAADAHDLGGHRGRPRGPGRDEPAAHGLPAAHPAGERHGNPGPTSERGIPAAAVSGAAADAEGERRHEGRSEPAGQFRGSDPAIGSAPDWGQYGPAVARWEQVTGRTAPRPTDTRRRLTPAFVEWLMGLPAGWVTAVPDLTRNQQLHALGNGVVPLQAIAALHTLLPAYEQATGTEAETSRRVA
ncbi:DNA cytosine methyltransferase [Planobispora rosea]|uniref:DNA cytosine methyltransferase n=1 Tax=Planobispora rosea TaxID=35762 RepID=UPI00083B5225|nr:DNA cytosine methyltransferase [Planobispora rosea]